MGQTIIKVKCTDQELEIIEDPVVSSGGFNENKVVFEFCPLWSGFEKYGVFYVTEKNVCYAPIGEDDSCIIPHEVCERAATIHIGAFGVNSEGIRRSTNEIKYKIVKGAIESGHKPSDPTPDLYTQILSRIDSICAAAESAAESAKQTAEAAAVANSAAKDANEAADNANKAAYNANKAADNINNAVQQATTAADNANNAATSADNAADRASSATSDAQEATQECSLLVAEVEQKLENGDFTPKKNVDYFTPEEKQEMINDVLSSLPRDITITSWKAVQEVVRAGKAAEVFSIGDQIECQHDVFGTLLWDVIGIDHDTPADSQYEHSITLQLHDCLSEPFMFDEREPISAISHYRTYGSNTWRDSALRQWLNSDSAAGNWWVSQTGTDVAPDYATTHDGFMKGLDEDFLSVVGAVSKCTLLNDFESRDLSFTDDTFFLLSKTEIYGGLNYGIAEGKAYPYYALNSDLAMPGDGDDSNRIKYLRGYASGWALRSIKQGDGLYNIRYVSNTGGSARQHGARNTDGIAPACCIY